MMDRARELTDKYLDGIATPEEIAELDRLLRESPPAAEVFARASRRDQAFERTFRQEEAVGRFRSRFRSHGRRRLIAAAAGLAAAALAFALLRPAAPLATILATGDPVYENDTVRGPASIGLTGERSHIDLRAGAELTLRTGRAELRAGELEAVIAPRPGSHALRFATPHAEAQILGTRFTLSAGRDSSRLDVFEGRVRFERTADRAAVEIRTGQSASTVRLAAVPIRSLHEERFLELWREIHDPANGYFSPGGVPYHAVETFLIDAPDYGHLSTSETFSYWIWLEAMYGRLTGDWSPLNQAWRKMEETLIPSAARQPTNRFYNPQRPATVVPEVAALDAYPVAPDPAAPVGEDRLARELAASHGAEVYAMHWLVDPDDWYGFGGGLVNTYQRGPEESVWETIPHPSWEAFAFGGPNGFLDRFIREPKYSRQWRYVCAPDADARVIQAMYWAARWAHEQQKDAASTVPLLKAARLGDFLRYALLDKYFRADTGLLSWSFAWGGSIEPANGWAWRAGSHHVHFGYQNPFAAWALAELKEFAVPSPTAARDWKRSLERQVEFYRWLQSAEGAIAGGATGSRTGPSTFYGLAYEPHPVFRDPDSNEWFGWQAWSMERLAQYASTAGDLRAKAVVDAWAAWARREVLLPPDGSYAIPSKLRWTGRPDPWTPERPSANADLHVTILERTDDVGVAAALARALIYHGDEASRKVAGELLDRMWTRYRDDKGVAAPEPRADYSRLLSEPQFLKQRPQYRSHPEFARVEAAVRRGEAPVFRYHRFWAQVEVALALAEFSRLSR